MNVLVLNAGSNSLKFEVIAARIKDDALNQQRKLVSGAIENIGEEPTFSLLDGKQVVRKEKIDARDYNQAMEALLAWFDSAKQESVPAISDLDAVGHRIVHGGDIFEEPVVIDDGVVSNIIALEELAPLHNAAAMEVIKAAQHGLGKSIPMVAVFDTVFHRTIPARADIYPLPLELSRKHSIRRYGFHGISHEYLMRRYAKITGQPVERVTIITLHLESGCSICAMSDGTSVDTSMGIIRYLMRKVQVSIEKVEEWLNKESGLLGVSGKSHDTRELMRLFDTDERSRLALEIFCYRIRKYIGAYLAALGSCQGIIFGGGIGEDTPFVRARALKDFGWFGLTIDPARNEQTINREGVITTDDSRLCVYVIPVEEGLLIAQQVAQCLKAGKDE
jgi:acetate kinase